MASPISGAPIDPIPNTTTVSYTNADLTIKNPDTISLYSFLQQVDTSKTSHKHTVFDGQEVDALMNKEYFLGVYQDINVLLEKYRETVTFSHNLSGLAGDYNSRVDSLNTKIDTYNNAKDVLNTKIGIMNDAINTINSISSPTASDIATYNAAVANYNSYLTSTGNHALLVYKNSANSIYNVPTNHDNTVVIPAINAMIDDLNLGIPHVAPLSPSTAPAGANPPIAPAGNYAGGPIALINPSSYSNLGHLNHIPDPQSEQDIVNTYFLPFAQNYLATMAATAKKLSGNDDYRAFVNFILKQGFNLNPASVNAFINKTEKPSLPSSSAGTGSSVGSLIVGVESPNLERILSTALFSLLAGNASISIPPHVYDQINVFAVTLLSTLGASAALSVVNLLGDTLKSLKSDNPAIDVALAAAILQNILKIVADSKVFKDGLSDIIKEIPDLTEAQQTDLTNKLVTSISTSLLLNAGLSTALTLKSPNLVQDFVNTAISQITDSNDAESNTGVYADNAFSPKSLNDLLKNDTNNVIAKRELSNRLENLAPNVKSNDVANSAIDQTLATLPENATQDDFQQALALNLQKSGIDPTLSQTIASSVTASINLAIEPPAQRPVLTPAALAIQVEASIRAIIKDDATHSLPEAVLQNIVKNLTDVTDPNSFISLLKTQIQTLVATNDKKVDIELKSLLREYMSTTIDSFVVAEFARSPAGKALNSFLTGLMWDTAIPTNFQRPLSIQV